MTQKGGDRGGDLMTHQEGLMDACEMVGRLRKLHQKKKKKKPKNTPPEGSALGSKLWGFCRPPSHGHHTGKDVAQYRGTNDGQTFWACGSEERFRYVTENGEQEGGGVDSTVKKKKAIITPESYNNKNHRGVVLNAKVKKKRSQGRRTVDGLPSLPHELTEANQDLQSEKFVYNFLV